MAVRTPERIVNRWLSRLGIRARLLLLMAGLGVPFVMYLATSLSQSFEVERAHARREVRDAAELAAARLEDQLSSIALLLNTLGHGIGPALGDARRVDALLHKLEPEVPAGAYNLSVWARDGHNVGSLHAEARQVVPSIAAKRYFQEVLRTGRLVVEAPVTSRVNGEYLAVFSAPALQDEQVVGVIVLSVQLSRWQALLDPKQALPKGGVITVVDADGRVVSRSVDPGAWLGKQMIKDPLALAAVRRDGPGVRDQVSFDGVHRSFGHAPVKTVPWLVYVGVPTEVATATARRRLEEGLILGLGMLLIGLLLASWAAERIARPLYQLAQDAERLGHGELGHRSQVRGMHEIAQLASTLNQTAEALQQRSQALQDAQALLRKVTDHVPALVSLLDREERFRFANLAYRDWLGLQPLDLVGRTLGEVYGAQTYEALRPHLRAAWAGQHTVYERPMTTLAGERWVEVTLVPRRDPTSTEPMPVDELCVMILDVTERHLARQRLARSEERLSLALEGSGLALFDWDVPGQRVYHSAQAAVLRGEAPRETIHTPEELRALVHPEDAAALQANLIRALRGEMDTYSVEFRVRTAQGGWAWLRRRGRVVERDDDGRALRMAGTDADITERKAGEDKLRRLAEFDTLTGLPNRATFMDRLHKAVQRATREGRPMAVMYLDIDHFKQVNDTFGHEAGDELLKVFAQRLTQGVRQGDLVARMAGDEFTILLEDLREPGNAGVVARGLVEAARHSVLVGAQRLCISTSVGVAVWTQGQVGATELLRQADAALYEAKRLGRDRCHVVVARPELREELLDSSVPRGA